MNSSGTYHILHLGHYNGSETITFQGLMHIFTFGGLHI